MSHYFSEKIIFLINQYRISRIICFRKFWRKWRLEGVLNFHQVLFSLFQGLSMKTYSRVHFSLCLILAISGRSRTQRKLNPHEKFPIYGSQRCIITRTIFAYDFHFCDLISSWLTYLPSLIKMCLTVQKTCHKVEMWQAYTCTDWSVPLSPL